MFFITSGTVEFYFVEVKQAYSYIEIQENYYFGEVDFLFSENQNYMHCTKAGDSCELLTLTRDNFFSLISIYPEDTIDLCIKAKDRLNRINTQFKDALFKAKHNFPINKKKTYPRHAGIFPRISLTKKSSINDNSSRSPEIKLKTLFSEIVEFKMKTQEIDGKFIRKKISELEKIVDEFKEIVYALQSIVATNNNNFSVKYPQFSSSDTSLIESLSISRMED